MHRQSFREWRLPGELDGVVLVEDHAQAGGRFASQERHFHEELELHFVDRGSGLFLLSRGRLRVTEGSVVWVPARRDHLLLEATPDFRRWMLLCRLRAVRRVLPKEAQQRLLSRTATEESGLLPPRARASLRQTFREVQADRGREIPLFNAALGFALARAWVAFTSAASSPEPSALHPAVSTAVRLLREGGSARPSVPELAARAGVTESHLSKLFSSQVGVSITEFRNRIGLERFLDLAAEGDRTLLDAALEAGFGSYPQFHRVFRRHMGYPPAEHRARRAAGATVPATGVRRSRGGS